VNDVRGYYLVFHRGLDNFSALEGDVNCPLWVVVEKETGLFPKR